MECRAKRDGQIDGKYVFEDEIFEAKRCPSWAAPVKKATKAAKDGENADGKGEA
jgi:hypothetical protein